MALYLKWKNFCIAPRNPDRIFTAELRLKTSGFPLISQFTPEDLHDVGCLVIEESYVTHPDDHFEAIFIGEGGVVIIWTEKEVWTVRRCGNTERLMALPRHPKECH